MSLIKTNIFYPLRGKNVKCEFIGTFHSSTTFFTLIRKYSKFYHNMGQSIQAGHIPSNFLKAVFRKFYLIHS